MQNKNIKKTKTKKKPGKVITITFENGQSSGEFSAQKEEDTMQVCLSLELFFCLISSRREKKVQTLVEI